VTSNTLRIGFIVASWILFLLAIAWPTVALVISSVSQGFAPAGGFTFSGRQWGLLGISGGLSVAATVLCLLVSIPGAYVMGRGRRPTDRPWFIACGLAVLLTPPMVYAFGWQRIIPPGINACVPCVAVWALWAWPIPAMLIGAGWSRVGRRTFEAASLVTSTPRAFLCAVLPSLLPYVLLSSSIVFVLFFGDYGVPHAFGLVVYTTELLGWATNSSRTLDTACPAILPTAVTVFTLSLLFRFQQRCTAGDVEEVGSARREDGGILQLAALGCFLLAWVLPIGWLVIQLASPAVFTEAVRIYAEDLAWSLGVAALSGVAVMGMGLGIVAAGALRRVVVVWAVVFGALPGALIGEALIAAYSQPFSGWLYDHWPIVALGYIARFGWIGVLAGAFVADHLRGDVAAQARLDGASETRLVLDVLVPLSSPLLVGGAVVVATLSLADVATTSLVRVPTFAPIACVVIDKFHRQEDGMLVSLSLCLIAATLLAVWALSSTLRAAVGGSPRPAGTGPDRVRDTIGGDRLSRREV